MVLSVSADDLRRAEGGAVEAPTWFDSAVVGHVIAVPDLMAELGQYETLAGGPFAWLERWIAATAPDGTRNVARAIAYLLARGGRTTWVPPDVLLWQVARAALRGEPMEAGVRQVHVWRAGAVVAAVELRDGVMDLVVALDDRDESLEQDDGRSWRQWLTLSNALALRDWPTTLTTLSVLDADAAGINQAPVESPRVSRQAPAGQLDPAWAEALASAAPGAEHDLVVALASHGGVAAPAVGQEGPDGIMLDLSWPGLNVAVEFTGMPDAERRELQDAGWTVVRADLGAVLQAVGAAALGTGAGSHTREG